MAPEKSEIRGKSGGTLWFSIANAELDRKAVSIPSNNPQYANNPVSPLLCQH